MKRIGIIAAAILVLVIVGILVINGRKIDTDVTKGAHESGRYFKRCEE